MKSSDEDRQGPVIRDRRRIDPVTGKVRDVGQGSSAQPAPGQTRPGKHSVSRPGGIPGSAAGGSPAGAAGGARPASPAGSKPGAGAGAGATSAGPAAGPGMPGPAGAGGTADESGSGEPGAAAGAAGLSGTGYAADAAAMLAERTADLQRLQAEYANYRKRVERDRMAVREQALANVLLGLLPVLDDIGRAREHEELTGGFKSVADSLDSVAAKLGLTTFGENGDPFDPNLHEALMHSYSDDVSEPTCVRVLQPGYKVGDRILRPARVAVAEPSAGAGSAGAGSAQEGSAQEGGAGAGSAQGSADEDAAGDSGRPAGSQRDGPPGGDAHEPGDRAPTGAD
jgi:molecular chaperone GrpE